MKTWQQFLQEKKNTNYDFSSTQVNLPHALANKIIKWGKVHIPDNELHELGREDEIHATVLYGIHDSEPDAVKKLLKSIQPINIKLGKISLFSDDEYDVIKIDVRSPDLHKLNAKLRDSLKYTSSHPIYKPHVTIAYVKKGRGKKYDGLDPFDNNSIKINQIIFSSKDGTKTTISLFQRK